MPWSISADLGGDYPLDRRIPMSLRGATDRSKPPTGRHSGIIPTLTQVLVPNTSGAESSVKKALGIRSRSRSRSRSREFSRDLTGSRQPGSVDMPNLPVPLSDEASRGRRRSSSLTSALGDKGKSRGRSASRTTAKIASEHPGMPKVKINSNLSIKSTSTPASVLNRRQFLRHVQLPTMLTPSDEKTDAICLLRVYRADGTFGTIACALNITAEWLLQLAARKFFIEDSRDYHLIALYPDKVRIFLTDSKPALLLHKNLVLSGYSDSIDQLNAVSRDDTSFLCRIVMANINDPLRPPLLRQSHRELILTNTDVSDAPSLVCAAPQRVESMDASRSSFQGTTLSLPRLKTLRLNNMVLQSSKSIANMTLAQSNLLSRLTTLQLAGNGLTSLDELDLTLAPNLQRLDLRGNDLDDLPAGLHHLPFLRELLCGSNALTSYTCWSPSLFRLDLSYNKIQTLELSKEVAQQMVNLTILQLSANALHDYPANLRYFPALHFLDVRHNKINNKLTGLPASLQTLIGPYNKPLKLKHDDRSIYDSSNSAESDFSGLKNITQLNVEGIGMMNLSEKCFFPRITTLRLRNNSLVYIPETVIRSSPNLRHLDLSQNSINHVPEAIRCLEMLEDFSVANNLLAELPSAIFELPNLHTFDAHDNDIKAISEKAFTCPHLKSLNLASNFLTDLPIIYHGSQSLICLVLADNQLSDECFPTILHLKRLQILNLSYNFFIELPPGLFPELSVLEELYLSGNRLLTLPPDELAHATELRLLVVNSNRLHMLPAELGKATMLEVLDAAANQLRYNVANWTFDWNWRWNKQLHFLNLSSNERMEIRKSPQYIPSEKAVVDMGDFCSLPKIQCLGLMDVTVTTDAIPFSSENCRVRTFGSELNGIYKVGIADVLGFRPIACNDLVLERFRNNDDECLVAMFDGHAELASSGNKISRIVQEVFGTFFRRELSVEGASEVTALRNTFLTLHRQIGNAALMSPTEICHTTLGRLSSTALKLTAEDRASGTGATVVYIKGPKIYIATVGGASVVLSRANGTHSVLSKPLPPVAAELDRIRAAGGIVDPTTSFVNSISPYPRMIGCYTSGSVFSATPTIYEYDQTTIDPSAQIIIGTKTMWQYMQYESAADIARKCAHDPVIAAMKIRDIAMAYGLRDRSMTIVIGRPQARQGSDAQRSQNNDSLVESEFAKKRLQPMSEDSTVARLGSEISPPFGDVTMVFTDIKSSTYLWENFPTVMQSAIKTHNSLMRRSIRLMDGYEVKNEGDAFIVSFQTPAKALIWCLTVQQHLLTAEWPQQLLEVDECKPIEDANGVTIFRGLSVRMGIHCGRPVTEPDPVTHRMDYFGPMVNRASRISGVALGGQISVSMDFLHMLNRTMEAHRQVHDGASLEEAYGFTNPSMAAALDKSAAVLDHTDYIIRELGELKLRGIENPEQIYNIYPASLLGREKYYEEERAKQQQFLNSEQSVQDQPNAAGQPHKDHRQELDELRKTSELSYQAYRAAASANHDQDEFADISPPLSTYADGHDSEESSRRKSSLFSDDFNSFDGYLQDIADTRGLLMENRRPSQMLTVPAAHVPHPVISHAPMPLQVPVVTSSPAILPSPALAPAPVVAPSVQTELCADVEPLQLLSMRLEAACASLADQSTTFADSLATARALEPTIPVGSELAALAQPLWLTRIENAICNLERRTDWP